MEEFETPGGTVRWSRTGSGSPVVLLHGTPFSSFVWRDIAAALAGRHEVFVWDMPGYGRSEMRAGQDVSLGAQGAVFASLLEHWGLESPSVVAHDFGGAVALRAHLLHGARYRRLALVDAVAIAPWGSPFFRLVHQNAAVFEQLPPHLHAALVREYVGTASGFGLRADVLDVLVAPWLGPGGGVRGGHHTAPVSWSPATPAMTATMPRSLRQSSRWPKRTAPRTTIPTPATEVQIA
jgi:pimeloyl-ACP methyl ester carboxylesterase